MENQKDKKKKKVLMPFGLRNKLMAAISMLLVSSIMLVSSTYAWFTLSTAPEVKGISTSVGANGNLEMALLTSGDADLNNGENTFADLSKITSAVGDSSAATNNLGKSNLTWGNLVDLSYENATTNKNYYGLDTIKLMPARLNNVANAEGGKDVNKLVKLNPLSTPTYGNDGRVKDLSGTTIFSANLVSGQGFKYEQGKDTYGVRAVGVSADMTPQQSGLMKAKSNYTQYMSNANSIAQAALKNNMQELANAMLALAKDGDNATLSAEQQTAISNLLTEMRKSVNAIDMAYGEVLRAAAATQIAAVRTYETLMETTVGTTTFAGANYTALKAAIDNSTINGVTVPENADFTTATTKLAEMYTALDNADNYVTQSNYKGAVKVLVETDYVELAGLSMKKPAAGADESEYENTIWAKDGSGVDKNKIINAVMGNLENGVEITMKDNSGLFANIATAAKNYSAKEKITIALIEGDVEGGTTMPVIMGTDVIFEGKVDTLVSNMTITTEATGVTQYVTDTYGYIIDLAVRTNATSSYLKLASTGVQRVYTDGTNTETLGEGSTMSFKSVTDTDGGDPVLNDTQVMDLMEAIRVVFFDPDEGNIYGIASLDSISRSGDAIKGTLVLKTYSLNADGTLKLEAKAADATEADKLMDLQQNTATKISVLVYLDGDKVDNSMVANAAQSITGSLNLQFASSANLVPMQNSALKNGTTN